MAGTCGPCGSFCGYQIIVAPKDAVLNVRLRVVTQGRVSSRIHTSRLDTVHVSYNKLFCSFLNPVCGGRAAGAQAGASQPERGGKKEYLPQRHEQCHPAGRWWRCCASSGPLQMGTAISGARNGPATSSPIVALVLFVCRHHLRHLCQAETHLQMWTC